MRRLLVLSVLTALLLIGLHETGHSALMPNQRPEGIPATQEEEDLREWLPDPFHPMPNPLGEPYGADAWVLIA